MTDLQLYRRAYHLMVSTHPSSGDPHVEITAAEGRRVVTLRGADAEPLRVAVVEAVGCALERRESRLETAHRDPFARSA